MQETWGGILKYAFPLVVGFLIVCILLGILVVGNRPEPRKDLVCGTVVTGTQIGSIVCVVPMEME